MNIKFKIFKPYWEWSNRAGCNTYYHADIALNDWLKENPNVEILSWQTTAVGTTNELYITIQYREQEE